MVLTEEQQTDSYPAATMESATAGTEEAFYTNMSTTRVDRPSGFPSATGQAKVARVTAAAMGNKVGPAILLKVMSGDKFNVMVHSWWNCAASPGSAVSPLNDLVMALASGIAPLSGGKAVATELLSPGVLSPNVSEFLSTQPIGGGSPKAYLNWILLDEQFKYVSQGSGFDQVGGSNQLKTHSFTNMPISQNGYLYIYVSNETDNIDVFFDNLQVTHVRGPLLEETHYYPFGLTMQGISSKALNGAAENNYKFNGIEQNSSLDINTYDAFYRNLDPQIGRFWQIDPETEQQEFSSPYESMGNNPINNIDPLGDFKTKFGAWVHRLFNGGGKIEKNELGEWSVLKAKSEISEDGTITVTAYKYYGKGRNKNSTAQENLVADMNIHMDIFWKGDNSMYQIYDHPADAGWAAVGISTGLATVNPFGRISANTINASQLARQGRKIADKISKTLSSQKQARHLAGTVKAGGGFLDNIDDAKRVLDAVHSGEAVFLGVNKAGNPVFRFSGVTGTNVNLGVGVTGQKTNLFMIKGTSSPSVVPISPAWIP
jgi:RHS repeat-associated protein